MRSSWLIVGALALALTGCGAPGGSEDEATGTVSQAITSGEDDARDRATVALMSKGEVYCTGTLVSRFVIVTAGHCVDGWVPDTVYFGSDPTSHGGTRVAVADFRAHPDFDHDTLENDIGVVALVAPAPASPARFAESEDDEPLDVGRSLKIVGFGLTAGDADDVGTKRVGDTMVKDVDDSTFRIDSSPSQTCKGDSGGPAFATTEDGHDVLIGVTSSGDGSCAKGGTDTRVSAYSRFVNDYIAERHVPSSGCSTSVVAPRGALPGLLAIGLAIAVLARRVRRGSTGDAEGPGRAAVVGLR